jgi:hypothetical protein
MRKVGRFIFVLSAVAALGFWTLPASAGTTFGAEVFGAYNSYDMGDVNGVIELQSSGATFDELSGGITGGLGLRLWANPNWMFSAAWEPLRAETELASPGTTTINANANSFQLTGAYFFPSATKSRFGFGAGGGYYSLGGRVEDSANPSDPDANFDVEGSGFGFHGMGMGEFQINPSFSITSSAGYRFADIEIKDRDTASPDPLDGKNASYTGLMARVGFAFYMPTAN